MNGPLHYLERKTESYADEPFFDAPEMAHNAIEAVQATVKGAFAAGVAGWISEISFRSAAPHLIPAFTENDLPWKLADLSADIVYSGIGVTAAWAAVEGADLAWRGLKRSFELARAQ